MWREEIISVTPEMAAKWLETQVKNRIVLQMVVDRYAAVMRLGLWMLSPQPIVFDSSQHLIDGQHRLWAVVLSGITIKFKIVWNVDEKTQLVLDQNTPRNAADNVNLASQNGMVLSHDDLTVLRYMLAGAQHRPLPLTGEVVQRLWPEYKANILIVKQACGGRTAVPASAVLRAICSRALYTADETKIERFCQIIVNGEIRNPLERIAIILRDMMLIEWRTGQVRPTFATRYGKIQSALSYFLKGSAPKKLFAVEGDTFKIPESSLLSRIREQVHDMETRRAKQRIGLITSKRDGERAESPKALRILSLLQKNGRMTARQLMSEMEITFNATQSLIGALRRAGRLAKSEGRNPFYEIAKSS